MYRFHDRRLRAAEAPREDADGRAFNALDEQFFLSGTDPFCLRARMPENMAAVFAAEALAVNPADRPATAEFDDVIGPTDWASAAIVFFS